MSSESQQAMTNACNKRHREFYAARKNSENEHWSGLMSQNKYYCGFFTAAMKVPTGFTSGVVVAFYLSNADVFPHNHDEIDSGLPGHERIELWVLQTNICGNGSLRIGRGEILTMVRPNNRFSRI